MKKIKILATFLTLITLSSVSYSYSHIAKGERNSLRNESLCVLSSNYVYSDWFGKALSMNIVRRSDRIVLIIKYRGADATDFRADNRLRFIVESYPVN